MFLCPHHPPFHGRNSQDCLPVLRVICSHKILFPYPHLRVEIFLDPVLAFLSPVSPSHERQSKMASRFTLLACLTVLFTGTSVSGADAVPPAAFVFGDSLVDAGNNNYLVTLSRANYPPNGIDFDGHRSTGRYTNGRTIVDILGDRHIGYLITRKFTVTLPLCLL